MNIGFVDTVEYRRFQEFCDASRRDHYIGLCYGPPGVGKTLSARRYTNWDQVSAFNARLGALEPDDGHPSLREIEDADAILITPNVLATHAQMATSISKWRHHMRLIGSERVRITKEPAVEAARLEMERIKQRHLDKYLGSFEFHDVRATKEFQNAEKNWDKLRSAYVACSRKVKDPTKLIIVDEADRLKMNGLEQLRSIFDEGEVSLILIGMPGIEKRLSRYDQLYSRIGFVHQFRPLVIAEVQKMLEAGWTPPGAALPNGAFDDQDGIRAILRVCGGNFRLLHRLLTQVARVLEINDLTSVTCSVVDAARESLVIGTD